MKLSRTVNDVAKALSSKRPMPTNRVLDRNRMAGTTLLFGVVVGLLYVHALYELERGFWRTEDGFYSPFLLGIAGWLAWRQSVIPGAEHVPVSGTQNMVGLVVFMTGLTMLLLGRILGNITLEFGSIQFVLTGLIVALAGMAALRRHIWAIGTLAIAVPLPGSAVVALTFPLKMAAAAAAAGMLRVLGLPIERQGVMLDIGSYRLMVVDACSGLQSMYSLIAAVFLYLALTGDRSRRGTILLLVAILPIAFLANVLRVVILAIITYVWGDAAGEGFLHGVAGFTMFAIALACIITLDHPRGPAR